MKRLWAKIQDWFLNPTNQMFIVVTNRELVIHVPIDLLAYAAERAPFVHSIEGNDEPSLAFRVTDARLFARSVASRLLADCRDEDPGALLLACLDDAAEMAVDDDLPGWVWPGAGKGEY